MKTRQRSTQLRIEIVSIVLFSLSLGIFLSLISYNASDPSLNVYYSNPQKIYNILGIVGACIADMAYQVFGMTSFLVVLILFQLSFRLFLTLRFSFPVLESLGLTTLVFSSAGILHVTLGNISLGNFSGYAGGVLGYGVATFLIKYLNTVGSGLFLLLIVLLSLMVSLRLSVARTGTRAVRGLGSLFRRLKKNRAPGRGVAASEDAQAPAGRTIPPKEEPSFSQEENQAEMPPHKETADAGSSAIVSPSPPELSAMSFEREPASCEFNLPPLSLLQVPEQRSSGLDREVLNQNSRLLENKLADFGVQARVTNVHPGPVVTLYELEPASGVKINRIVNLADDLALALRAFGIRIIAPIPGKGVIGVEIPNPQRETVFFREIVSQDEFLKSNSLLTLGLGKDISGKPIVTDLAAMPHLLIAGTTGSGKSVFINTLICSILYKALPSEVKLLIMDPKRSELTFYAHIPHLLYPVVTDAKQAANVLRWALEEMDRRYDLLARMGSRDIMSYNQRIANPKAASLPADAPQPAGEPSEPLKPMPWIVIVIDELANLMMVSSREVEWSLARLAQMARAAGIHLLVATQRPSVDIITGTIKANFPARISFRLASKTDSRIILDTNGAENLLNQGDMLFLSPRTARLKRIHGPFISDDEIRKVVTFLASQAKPDYQELDLDLTEEVEGDESAGEVDEKYHEAIELVTSLGQASISLVQRKLRIGYNRAARIIERMEEDGIVGPSDGVKPREVLRKMMDI